MAEVSGYDKDNGLVSPDFVNRIGTLLPSGLELLTRWVSLRVGPRATTQTRLTLRADSGRTAMAACILVSGRRLQSIEVEERARAPEYCGATQGRYHFVLSLPQDLPCEDMVPFARWQMDSPTIDPRFNNGSHKQRIAEQVLIRGVRCRIFRIVECN
jgi:hypothetical protein